MIGWVVVMEPAEYQQWLAVGAREVRVDGGRRRAAVTASSAATAATARNSTVRAPLLDGVFGQPVALRDGRFVAGRRALHPRLDAAADLRTCRRATSRSCPPSRADQRGRTARDHRLHQVHRATQREGRCHEQRCSRRASDEELSDRQLELVESWLLTTDHKRIGDPLPDLDHAASSSSAVRPPP